MTTDIKELVKRLRERRDQLALVPSVRALVNEQMHLDEGRERDYWHYGYAIALTDVLRMLEEDADDAPIH